MWQRRTCWHRLGAGLHVANGSLRLITEACGHTVRWPSACAAAAVATSAWATITSVSLRNRRAT